MLYSDSKGISSRRKRPIEPLNLEIDMTYIGINSLIWYIGSSKLNNKYLNFKDVLGEEEYEKIKAFNHVKFSTNSGN